MAIVRAETKLGVVLGAPAGNHRVSRFLGIPYAKAPVGDLRWKPPVPAEPWEGERKCYTFSPIPVQPRRPKESFYTPSFFPVNDLPRSEDSLYINVWTPAVSADEKLPVAFWIFGGGFTTGFANKIEFDGEGFGKRGCVFVNFNYRLGPLGFLAHPELTAESPDHVSGNYGLLDQILALQWVRDNISAFGGDPEKITIFGQSAGGGSVMNFLCSPLTKGMFSQAIVESGGRIAYPGNMTPDLKSAEQSGVDAIKYLGFNSIEEARKMDGVELVDKLFTMPREGDAMAFRPVVDGMSLMESHVATIAKGNYHDVPIMFGSTSNEGYAMPKDVFKNAKGFGDMEQAYLEACGVTADSPKNAVDHMAESQISGYLAWNKFKAHKGEETYYQYYFTKAVPGDDSGAFHSAEHFYVFQTLARDWRPYDGGDYELSDKMAEYWANFVKTGDPNGEGLPRWEKYGVNNQIMELGLNVGMIDPPAPGNVVFNTEKTLQLMIELGK